MKDDSERRGVVSLSSVSSSEALYRTVLLSSDHRGGSSLYYDSKCKLASRAGSPAYCTKAAQPGARGA